MRRTRLGALPRLHGPPVLSGPGPCRRLFVVFVVVIRRWEIQFQEGLGFRVSGLGASSSLYGHHQLSNNGGRLDHPQRQSSPSASITCVDRPQPHGRPCSMPYRKLSSEPATCCISSVMPQGSRLGHSGSAGGQLGGLWVTRNLHFGTTSKPKPQVVFRIFGLWLRAWQCEFCGL